MFKRIRASFLWAKMLKQYKDGDYDGASESALKYRELNFDNIVFDVFDATLNILNHEPDCALIKFTDISSRIKNYDKRGKMYITLYCEYYVCLIQNHLFCDDIRLKANQSTAPKHIKKWLPLPNEPIE